MWVVAEKPTSCYAICGFVINSVAPFLRFRVHVFIPLPCFRSIMPLQCHAYMQPFTTPVLYTDLFQAWEY